MYRLLADQGDWAQTRAAFRWNIPKSFNIAQACCGSWAARNPDKIALIDVQEDGRTDEWSYGALENASSRLANSFRAHGVGHGDRVAVLLPQGPEVLIAHFAAYKIGAVVVPLFTLFGSEALAFRLTDSGAKLILTNAENLDKVVTIQGDLPNLSLIYCTTPAPAPVLYLQDELTKSDDQFEPVSTLADAPAMIIYTSGTTGSPKGALHAHRFLLGHLPSVEMHHGFFPKPGDCGWTPADWAWIGGLMDMAMPCLFYGVPLVSQRMRKFDPDAAYRLIGTHSIRNLFMPPTALKLMQNAAVPANVSIRSISSGGESLGAAMLNWAQDRLGAEINEIYGQTECNLVLSGAAHAGVRRAGAIGQAVPGHDVVILGADGVPASAGDLGEIAVRAPDPVMFLGYWNNPGATAEKFRGDWLLTGDLGTMGVDGYVTFVGRDDDVISSAGYRIGPSEIENCLKSHADVVMAAVVGVPDPVRTQVVKAYVVLRDGADWAGLEDELIASVRTRISPHMAPKSIERIDEMPMTATGKIMRRKLRERRD